MAASTNNMDSPADRHGHAEFQHDLRDMSVHIRVSCNVRNCRQDVVQQLARVFLKHVGAINHEPELILQPPPRNHEIEPAIPIKIRHDSAARKSMNIHSGSVGDIDEFTDLSAR